jgi:hypothetical protein
MNKRIIAANQKVRAKVDINAPDVDYNLILIIFIKIISFDIAKLLLHSI